MFPFQRRLAPRIKSTVLAVGIFGDSAVFGVVGPFVLGFTGSLVGVAAREDA